MATMDFLRETYSDAFAEELKELIQKHHEEVSLFKDFSLSINWNIYAGAESSGMLRIFTARKAGVLCGYAIFFVGPHPHFRESVHAEQDSIFISPEHRGGRHGLDFIRWCDERLRESGVQVVIHRVTAARDFGPVLENVGYQYAGKIYMRRLSHG